MIRWKTFIPLAVAVVLGWVLTHFFLDRAIERGLETAGTAANGARVDVDGVDTSFWRLSVVIHGLQIADAGAPMTNALDIRSIRLKLKPKPLFWKKIVVEKAEIAGIRTGTPRKRSGALPASAEKEADGESGGSNAVEEEGKEAASFVLGNLKDQYDPDKLVTLDSLASYRKIQEEKARLEDLPQAWQARVDALNTDDLGRRAQAFADRAKGGSFSGLDGLKRAKDLLGEGKTLKADLNKARRTFNETKSALQAEIALSKNALAEIDRLKKEDIDSRVNLVKSGFSAEGVTRALIGPSWNQKVQSGLASFEKIRKLSAKKDGAPKPAVPVRKGTDIPFPFHHRWPAFHLESATLSGETAGDQPLAYAGTLQDVSSDPQGLGRPIRLSIDGKKDQRSLIMTAALDYTKKKSRETLDLTYRGLPLAGLRLGELGGPVHIAAGTGVLKTRLETSGSRINGRIDIKGSSLKLALGPSAGGKNKMMATLHDVLNRVTRGGVSFLVSGDLKSPRIKMTSTLDDEINAAVKQAAQKELEELQNRLRARVNGLVDGDRSKLAGALDEKIKPLADKLGVKEKSLNSLQGQIQKPLDDLAEKGGGTPKIKDLKGLFKKK